MPRFLATSRRQIINGTRHNANKSLNYISRNINFVNFVPQQEVYIVERFGRYDRQKGGGLMFKWPFIESVSYVQGTVDLIVITVTICNTFLYLKC